jgi:hypothetical protein
MWNDEDNNPYGGSFDRRDSFASSANPSSPTVHECELPDVCLFCLPNFPSSSHPIPSSSLFSPLMSRSCDAEAQTHGYIPYNQSQR